MTAAAAMKARLRADLVLAMQARDGEGAALLRVLIALIDNAEAVPVGDAHQKYQVRAFGDPGVEAPRRDLSPADIDGLLRRELAERETSAADFERLGRTAEAQSRRAEALLIAGYLDKA
jgi:uncharacterized protein YqeY